MGLKMENNELLTARWITVKICKPDFFLCLIKSCPKNVISVALIQTSFSTTVAIKNNKVTKKLES